MRRQILDREKGRVWRGKEGEGQEVAFGILLSCVLSNMLCLLSYLLNFGGGMEVA